MSLLLCDKFMNKTKRIFLFLIIFLALLVGGIYIAGKYFSEKVIPTGYYIGKIYIGGLTRDEAINKLTGMDADDIVATPLSFTFEDEKKITKFEFSPSQAGLVINVSESVDNVINYFQEFRYFKAIFLKINKNKRVFFPVLNMDNEKECLELMENYIKSYVERPSSEATFRVMAGGTKQEKFKVVLIESQIGRRLITRDTVESLKNNLQHSKGTTKLVVHKDFPNVTTDLLKQIPNPSVIGDYTTYFGTHDSKNRIHNIFLVSSFVDNKVVLSGEVFSVLKNVGNFTEERGFKEAFVIIKDELVPELGGGTCQIATTLYNAAAFADLEIISRNNHGMYFGIYPLGRDSAVYPPRLDLKFKNNTGYPILIEAKPFKKGLTFYIIGEPTGKKVTFSDPAMYYKYFTVITEEAKTGKQIAVKVRSQSFKTIVLRKVEKNGRVVETEKIYSYYKLDGDKVKVKKRREEPQ